MAGQRRMELPGPDAVGGPLAILVVDDERPIVDLLTRYLTQHGYRAIGAYAPDQARDLVAADQGIGVVISDVRMPGGSGLALGEELMASRSDAAALEVVLITGGSVEAEGAAPTFDVLRKPFRPSEVASAAGRALVRSTERRLSAPRGEVLARPLTPVREADSVRQIPAGRLDQILRLMAAGLRAPLIPMLAAAREIETGQALTEAEMRDSARRIREEGLKLLALIDQAAGDPPGRG